MKHEMAKAEVDVSLDALDVLICVGGNDPALRRAFDGQCVGEPLHFERVFDRELFFGGKAERRPIVSVFHCPLQIGIERDFDLDHALNRIRFTPGRFQSCFDVRQERLRVERAVLTARADEPLGSRARIFRNQRAGAGDINRHGHFGAIVDRREDVAIALKGLSTKRLARQAVLPRDEIERQLALDLLQPEPGIVVGSAERGPVVDGHERNS